MLPSFGQSTTQRMRVGHLRRDHLGYAGRTRGQAGALIANIDGELAWRR